MINIPEKFTAFRIHQNEENGKKIISSGFEQIGIEDLTEGEVIIKVAYSDINYKDALAATGKGRILRTYPLVGGIDLSGVVVSSEDQRFSAGDKVLVCGAQLSELYDGGYTERGGPPINYRVACKKHYLHKEALSVFTLLFLGVVILTYCTWGLSAPLAVS